MSHTTEVINIGKKGGFYVATIRCCANPATDSDHSMDVSVFADEQKRKDFIAAARQRVAGHHELLQKAEAAMPEEVGKEVVHE